MQWIKLEKEEQLNEIGRLGGYQVILKHNTTCPISRGVLSRFELEPENIPGVDAMYLLDLLQHRPLSDAIAERYGVPHQSPQLLLINNGRCTYHEWGYDISADATAGAMKKARA
ncbi:MAG TPA: bacillithiol system redox-active protein YtxJ [Flavisolibacter sp.]|nr:bacillithiol system redox-active protein YtxJ [Flavisolibacter sp.]